MFRFSLVLIALVWSSLTYSKDLNLLPSEYKYKSVAPYNFLIMEPESIVESFEGGIQYKANTLGFRDVDFDISGDRSVVLVTGESRAFGMGIDYRQRWSNILSDSLNDRDVYNLAMPAASLEHQYLILEYVLFQLQRPVEHIIVQVPPQKQVLPLLRAQVWGTPKPRLMWQEGEWHFVEAPIHFSKSWPEHFGLSVYAQKNWERSLAKALEWVEQQCLRVSLSLLRSYYRREVYLRWAAILTKFEDLAMVYGSELHFITSDRDSQNMLKELDLKGIDIKDLSTSKYHVNPLVMHVNLEGNTRVAERVACQVFSYCESFHQRHREEP